MAGIRHLKLGDRGLFTASDYHSGFLTPKYPEGPQYGSIHPVANQVSHSED